MKGFGIEYRSAVSSIEATTKIIYENLSCVDSRREIMLTEVCAERSDDGYEQQAMLVIIVIHNESRERITHAVPAEIVLMRGGSSSSSSGAKNKYACVLSCSEELSQWMNIGTLRINFKGLLGR